jgi:UDP-glucose 4-epimerase
MFNLIVGGKGFIGQNLLSHLVNRGESGLVVDIEVWRPTVLKELSGNFKVIKPDSLKWSDQCVKEIQNRKSVRIWQLAANSDISKASTNFEIDYDLTLGSTIETLKVASQVDCSSLEFTSSSAVYGNRVEGAKFFEDDVLNPISNYGAMKVASEHAIRVYSDKANVPFHIYRLANIIGPNMTHGLIFDLVKKLRIDPRQLQVLGDGTQRKTYMHVSDLVESMVQISSLSNSLTVNIGPNDNGLSVSTIVEILLGQFKSNVKVQFETKPNGWHGDVTDSVMDTSHLQSIHPFSPRSSEESVREAIASRLNETS